MVPTVYPPVSQFVFRGVHRITPTGASVKTRVRLMKFVIVLFDIGVIGLLWLLLRLFEQNPGWFVAYGWSPLVIKEFAGSGHLDSIAVFLTMGSIVCVVGCSYRRQTVVRAGNHALASVALSDHSVSFDVAVRLATARFWQSDRMGIGRVDVCRWIACSNDVCRSVVRAAGRFDRIH